MNVKLFQTTFKLLDSCWILLLWSQQELMVVVVWFVFVFWSLFLWEGTYLFGWSCLFLVCLCFCDEVEKKYMVRRERCQKKPSACRWREMKGVDWWCVWNKPVFQKCLPCESPCRSLSLVWPQGWSKKTMWINPWHRVGLHRAGPPWIWSQQVSPEFKCWSFPWLGRIFALVIFCRVEKKAFDSEKCVPFMYIPRAAN